MQLRVAPGRKALNERQRATPLPQALAKVARTWCQNDDDDIPAPHCGLEVEGTRFVRRRSMSSNHVVSPRPTN